MTISLNLNTIPTSVQINGVPGTSVSDIFQNQIVFNTNDNDANSSGLYIWKSGAFGAQAWLRLATVNQITASQSRTPSYPARTLNTAFQPSATKDAMVSYSVDIACTLSLTTGATGTVFLEICPNSAFSANVQELGRFVNGNTGTLTLGLNLTQNVTGCVSGFVPAGYYVRLRTANTV